MCKLKIISLLVLLIGFLLPTQTPSKYQYIDTIDKIKELENIAMKYLNLGDTTNAIMTYLDIDKAANSSDIYSDQYISNNLYIVGKLYLLINDSINAEKYLLLAVESHNQSKIKNQMLMEDPLLSLLDVYSSDSLNYQTVLRQVNNIRKLKNTNLTDSLKLDYINFKNFEKN
ncbi:hypothetical protein OAY83_00575, partial [Candidatus Marinimicrobia bacterium]|nr:hypothetical protein [Candidatus Neomarinimicrobiota bacterium]